MAAFMTRKDAQRLFDMGLISEEEYRHYMSLADWRKILRAGANDTTSKKEKP
ncbi:MAG: hypothetical protein ABT940_08385 [Alphaproteobacteria bacterium]